jgi:hypothetical protein
MNYKVNVQSCFCVWGVGSVGFVWVTCGCAWPNYALDSIRPVLTILFALQEVLAENILQLWGLLLIFNVHNTEI